ncbi:hypothetical protein ACET3Z_028530 [Daucus carota]
MEQGKLKDILDVKLQLAEDDERVSIAIKVALWCIQYDMHLRPSRTKVVQMLEQVSPVPPPPSSSQQMNSHFYLSSFKSTSEHSTSLDPLDFNSCADFSAVKLSGPRWQITSHISCVSEKTIRKRNQVQEFLPFSSRYGPFGVALRYLFIPSRKMRLSL